MTILSGDIYWACIKEPHTKGEFPTHKYQIDLCNLSAADVQKIKVMGMGKLLKKKEGESTQGDYITLKNTRRPKLVNKAKEDILDIPLIGNKSKGIAQVSTYTNKFGSFLSFDTLMLTELIEYRDSSLDEFDTADQEPDSFTVTD